MFKGEFIVNDLDIYLYNIYRNFSKLYMLLYNMV